jgi:hypothetical protein
MRRPILSLVSVALVLLCVLVQAGCGGSGKGPDTAPGPGPGTAKVSPQKPDFSVTALEFTKEFMTDAKAAEAKYKDKVIELTGEVRSINPREAGKSVLVLLEGAKKDDKDIIGSWTQSNLLSESVPKGLLLSRKQKVKLTGKYEMNLGFVINIANCSLEELGKSQVIEVTAEDLAKEFAKDSEAARAKYTKEKDVIITGQIEELTTARGFHFAKLKGDGKTRVSVTLGPDEVKLLTKGQTARLRSELPYEPNFDKGEVSVDAGSVVGVK